MALFTLGIGLSAFIGRVLAVRKGHMKVKDFNVIDLSTATPFVNRSTRHIANLFEFPVLFYVVCLIALQLHTTGAAALVLAWVYVALRALHSIIHLTYNRVMHRMPVFMASNFVLLFLWLYVVFV
jgi:hypothetical protein